ncbi:MAG TPA: hypothetical protein PKD85_22130, partial [Saprospiraceae bacterium]|nr:hypothetical protein [Saprospiraceae bacterium]
GIDLFKAAKQKFKDYPNVFLYQGDSGVVLKDVVLKLQEPAVYWLDAHYSEGITARGIQDCPIYSELQTISKQKRKDCILIDDAVDFNGRNGYPTKEELISICVEMFPYHYFEEREGLFYILPR